MSIALDLGSHRFRSLRRIDEQLIARQDRAGYCVLPALDSYQHLLSKAGIPFARCEDSLILMGERSDEFAALFQTDFVPVVPNGQIPRNDPLSRQVLAAMVDAMLPDPRLHGESCYVALPQGSDDEELLSGDSEFFKRLIRLRGYEPIPMRSGMAVVLTDLVDTGFTGIGINFGASSCDAVLAWRGVEIASTHVAKGGNWIDECLATENDQYAWAPDGSKHLDISGAYEAKLSYRGSLLEPTSREEQLMATLYRDLIASCIQQAVRAFVRAPRLNEIRKPVPVVCAGGSTKIAGFHQLVAAALQSVKLPLQIDEVRESTSVEFAVARGCLIAAELDQQPHAQAA